MKHKKNVFAAVYFLSVWFLLYRLPFLVEVKPKSKK